MLIQAREASVPPKSIALVGRLTILVFCCVIVPVFSVVGLARIGAAPAIIELPQNLLPGKVPPSDARCGGDDTCYPPVDSHCYESGDAGGGCVSSAAIQYNDQKIALLIDIASRTIALTSISAPGYSMGDLILAWGTPTGFSQFDRDIDVYWGARSTHLVTCLFRPESRVDVITFYRNPAFATPWHGFVRVNSKAC